YLRTSFTIPIFTRSRKYTKGRSPVMVVIRAGPTTRDRAFLRCDEARARRAVATAAFISRYVGATRSPTCRSRVLDRLIQAGHTVPSRRPGRCPRRLALSDNAGRSPPFGRDSRGPPPRGPRPAWPRVGVYARCASHLSCRRRR